MLAYRRQAAEGERKEFSTLVCVEVKGQQLNKDWVRTLLTSGGRAPSSEGGNTPPGGNATGNTLSEFGLISITSIQKARIWEREETIRGRVGENNPFGLKTCDICQGEFPCWEQACPLTERFVRDDCADDALDQTGSPATR